MRTFLLRLWTHSKNVAYWLTVEAWPAWLAVAGIPACLALGWGAAWAAHKDGTAAARFASIALEFAGLVTVAKGLRDTRKLFESKPILQKWREKMPTWPGNVTVRVASSNISLGDLTLQAHGTTGPIPNATIEERVAWLEAYAQRANLEVSNLRQALDRNSAAQSEAVQAESVSRAKGDSDLHKLIDKAVIGGLSFEAAGLFWLIAGLIVGGLSTELGPYIPGL